MTLPRSGVEKGHARGESLNLDVFLDDDVSHRRCKLCKDAELVELVDSIVARMDERGVTVGWDTLHRRLKSSHKRYAEMGPSCASGLRGHCKDGHTDLLRQRAQASG